MPTPKPKGTMTCRQAGRKGGRATAQAMGPDHYRRIGSQGAQKYRELLAKGKAAECTIPKQ